MDTKVSQAETTATSTKKKGTNLIEDEKAAIGGVKLSVYTYYARCIGFGMTGGSFLMYLFYTVFSVFSSIWLSIWSTDPEASTVVSVRNKYLSVYGVLGFLQSGFIMVGTIMISIGTLNAASKLHKTMLYRILRSPMSFFDTTPLGRILNRFSKDIDIVDVTLPGILRGLIGQLLGVLGTIIIVCYANYYFIAVIIPLGISFSFYLTISYCLKISSKVEHSNETFPIIFKHCGFYLPILKYMSCKYSTVQHSL